MYFKQVEILVFLFPFFATRLIELVEYRIYYEVDIKTFIAFGSVTEYSNDIDNNYVIFDF